MWKIAEVASKPTVYRQPVALDVGAHVVGRRLLDADRHEREAVGRVRVVDVAQDRRLRLAGRAPRCPEVDPDRLAAQVGEPDRVAVQVGQLDRLAVDRARELGREIADAQPFDRIADCDEARPRRGQRRVGSVGDRRG